MAPTEQDGKKTALDPSAADSPAAAAPGGQSDFDWDSALDDWDPTFMADAGSFPSDLDPGVGKVVTSNSELIPVSAAPAAAASETRAPAVVPPAEPEAAPLPPPPVNALIPLDIEIDLSKAPQQKVPPTAVTLSPAAIDLSQLERMETTLAMDAREVDRLAQLLRADDAILPTAAPSQTTPKVATADQGRAEVPAARTLAVNAGAPAVAGAAKDAPSVAAIVGSPVVAPVVASTVASITAEPAREDEDFYDNIVVESQPAAATSKATPQVEPPAEVLQAATKSDSSAGLPVLSSEPTPGAVPVVPAVAASSIAPTGKMAVAPSHGGDEDDDELAIHVEIGTPVQVEAVASPAAAPVMAAVVPAVAVATVAVVSAAPVAEPVVAAQSEAAQPAPTPIPVLAAAITAPAGPQAQVTAVEKAAAPRPQPVAPPASVATATRAAPRPVQALTPRRLPLPSTDQLPLPPMTSPGGAGAPETSLRRQFLTLLDAEREAQQGRDARRLARLSISAARQAEALREADEALDRYRAAADADATTRAALRGSRRVLSWAGPTTQPDEAMALLDKEVQRSTPAERQGLALVRCELQRVQGQLAESERGFQSLRNSSAGSGAASATGQVAALVGLCDVTAAREATADLMTHLDRLAEQPLLPIGLRTAMQVLRARLDETAGRDAQAASRYDALLTATSGACLSASLGLLRLSARPGKNAALATTPVYETVLKGRLPRGLRAAVSCQLALASTAAERPARLAQAQEAGDWLVAERCAIAHEENGDWASAAQAYMTLAESVRDPLQRSLAMSAAGEAHWRAGRADDARKALLSSLRLAGASDLEADVFALRLFERICYQQGRMDDLLSLYSATSGLPAERAAYVHYLAGRTLLSQGREQGGAPTPEQHAAGMAELSAAVQLVPDYAPALNLLAERLIAAGRPGEAARLLLAAADAMRDELSAGERIVQQAYREEASRLQLVAGQAGEAARALLGERERVDRLPAPVRWRLAALSPRLAGDTALSDQIAAVLALEAEQTALRSRSAALWYARGVVLSNVHDAVSASLGPVEDSFRRAIAAEPGHAAALLALQLRALMAPPDSLAHSPLVHVALDGLRTRMEKAAGRPEAMLWALRLGAAQEFEARDAASALLTYKQLRTFAPDHIALVGLEDTLFVTAWRAGQAFETLERELQSEEDPDRRYALLLLSGEQLEAQGHPARAAERYLQALELRTGHPVAKAMLVRAYMAAGMMSELDAFTIAELKEATDVNTRVGAYERQARLAAQRGDSEGVINAYRNVLTFDTNNHAAMRALERRFIGSQQWGELVHLYEQMGLTATDTAYAVHINLDRARLRQRLVLKGQGDPSTLPNQLENDFRLALYRDRHCLPALRYLLASALRKQDSAQVATASINVAELCASVGDVPGHEHGDGRSAAIFYTRAAEAQIALSRAPSEVVTTYRAALKQLPDHLPALRGLLHFAVLQQDFATLADTAEALAVALHDTDERYLHYMLAGVVSQELLKDVARARRAYMAGLRLSPTRDEAFERLRVSYGVLPQSKENATALAELISERLGREGESAAQKSVLRLELAQLLVGPLGDRARARKELEAAIAETPDQPAVLYMLGKMLADDREWVRAAELLERYCKSEQRPSQLVALHVLLADMYSDHLQDPQQAIAHYTRVLQLQPQSMLALSKLADLFLSQQKVQGALPILRRLVKYTDDKGKRIAYYHRIAALCEQAADNRGALEALRQAVECDPMNLAAIGELAKYYNRQQDLPSMRIHLDRAAARFRPMLRERPRDPTALSALLQIFLWRGQNDSAQLTASILSLLGAPASADLQAQIDKLPPRKEPTKGGLRDAAVDDVLFPARVAPGFRALFRLLHEPLHKLYGDAKKLTTLGVDRREKLPRSGHPLRDLANKLAATLGVEEFDIYVTAALRTDEDGKKVPICTIEPMDPPAIIVSNVLVDGASEAERRFLLGGLLKLLQSHLGLPLSLTSYDLGLVIGALVRLYVPSYTPLGYAEKQIANEASRIKRAIPSKLQGQLLPHAMECSAAALDFDGIVETIMLAGHHAGLVLTGDIGSAVSMLRRKGAAGERLVDDLLRFAASEEFSELRRLVTAG